MNLEIYNILTVLCFNVIVILNDELLLLINCLFIEILENYFKYLLFYNLNIVKINTCSCVVQVCLFPFIRPPKLAILILTVESSSYIKEIHSRTCFFS